MSSTVMLTAGHCTEEGGVPNVRTWAKFTPDISIRSGCSTRKCLNRFLDDPANGWVKATRDSRVLLRRVDAIRGTVELAELNSTFNGGMSAKFTNNPGTNGGTCFGDSGGPVFYGNGNMIVAVVSFGITPCIGTDYQFRTDIETTQDFVDLFF